MQVFLLRGPSGCGKSSYGRDLRSRPYIANVIVVSADDIFTDDQGVYHFDPSRLGEAHQTCLRKFTEIARRPLSTDLLVVDNTNTTIAELSPYYAIAEAYGHKVQIVEVNPGLAVDQLVLRNVHGTPRHAIQRMVDNMRESSATMPPWWFKTTLNT